MGANPFIHVVSLLVGSEVHKQGLIRRVRDGEDISIWSILGFLFKETSL